MMASLEQAFAGFWQYLPYLAGGVAVLVVGWLVAWIVAAVIRKILARTNLDERIGSAMGKRAGEPGRLANWVATAVFWTILALAVIGALAVLQLTALSESLRQALDSV